MRYHVAHRYWTHKVIFFFFFWAREKRASRCKHASLRSSLRNNLTEFAHSEHREMQTPRGRMLSFKIQNMTTSNNLLEWIQPKSHRKNSREVLGIPDFCNQWICEVLHPLPTIGWCPAERPQWWPEKLRDTRLNCMERAQCQIKPAREKIGEKRAGWSISAYPRWSSQVPGSRQQQGVAGSSTGHSHFGKNHR